MLCSYLTKIFTLYFFFNRLLLVTWTRSLMSTIIRWKRCVINFALLKGQLPYFYFFWSSRLKAWNAFINTNVLSFEQWKNCLCNSLLYTRCKKQIHLVDKSTKRKIQQVSFWSVIFEFVFMSPCCNSCLETRNKSISRTVTVLSEPLVRTSQPV